MAKSRELRVAITGDPSSLNRAFSQISKNAQVVEGRMGQFGHAAARAFSVAGLGAVGALGGIIKAGADYEQQMKRVQAVTDSNGAQFKQLGDLAKKLGADTKFSASQAADAMYQLGSAGFKANEMSKVLPGTLALAAASGVELADAAEISANALRGFGLQSDKMGKVADVLAATVNRSSVEMDDLQLSLKYVGPIAKTTGQSFEQMVAAIGIMGDAGIKGEQAGTTLRGALVRLVNPTKSVAEGMSALHLSTSDLQGPKGLRPLSEIVKAIEDKTKGMDKATRNAALANIFGTEALSGMVTVIDKGSTALDKATTANKHADGAAKKAADTMNDTVKGKWDAFTGSVETASITLYEKFAPALKDALGGAADGVNQLATLPGKLAHTFKAMTATHGGAGAAIGALIADAFDKVDWSAIGKKISAGVRGALKTIGDVANGIGDAVVIAMGRVDWQAVGQTMSTGLSAALDFTGKLPGAISDGIGAALDHVDTEAVGQKFAAVLVGALATLADPGFWVHHLAELVSLITIVIPIGKFLRIPGFPQLYKWISAPVFKAVGAMGKGLLSLFGRAGSAAWTSFLAEVEKFAPKVAHALLEVSTRGAGALKSFPGKVRDWATKAMGAFADKLGDGIGKAAAVMLRAVGRLAGVAARIVKAIVGKFDDLAGNVPSSIAKSLAAGTRRMAGWVKNFAKAGLDLGKAVVNGIVDGIKSIPGKVSSALKGLVGGAVGGVKNFFSGKGDGVGKALSTIVPAAIPGGGMGEGLMGAQQALSPFAAIGSRFGLNVSSGRRPGSITSSGNLSYHATGEAIDEAGSPAGMMGFFKYMKSRFGSRLAELIYTPGGMGIKDGRPYRYTGKVAADHFDHVHVAVDTGKAGAGDGIGRSVGAAVGDGLGKFTATSYGPPWDGIQGGGVTATGVDLTQAPHRYGIAVDPSKLSLGKDYYVWPNPFAYHGAFKAFDTGGAIKGNRIDFYDWRGRSAQNSWGSKAVTVSTTAAGAKAPSAAQRKASQERTGSRIVNSMVDRFLGGKGGGRTLVRKSDAIGSTIDSADTGYGQTERLFGQTDEDLGTAEGRGHRVNELKILKGLKQQQLARRKKRAAALKAAVGKYEGLIKALNARLKVTGAKRVHGAARAKMHARIRSYEDRLDELKAELVTLGVSITDTELDIGDIDKDISTVEATPDTEPEKDTGPTPEDFLNADIVKASLTPDKADDIAAATKLRDYYKGKYDEAVAANDPIAIADWGSKLKSAQENTDALTSLTDSVDASNALAQQRMDLDRQLVDNQLKILAMASQGPEILAAVIAAVSGGIGGRAGLGFQSVGVAGSVARY